MMTNDQVLAAFMQLFQWVYQIQIPPHYQQGIAQHILSGWHNNDRSEHTLVAFVLDLSGKLSQVSQPELHRQNIQQHFANEFALLSNVAPGQLNDKYRILAVMHEVIETLRPGSTGLPLGIMQNQQEQIPQEQALNLNRMRSEMLRLGGNR